MFVVVSVTAVSEVETTGKEVSLSVSLVVGLLLLQLTTGFEAGVPEVEVEVVGDSCCDAREFLALGVLVILVKSIWLQFSWSEVIS